MLWQKGWWETRRGFLLYLVVLTTIATILLYTWEPVDLAKWTSSLQARATRWTENSRQLLPLLSSYHGYVWSYWFKLLLLVMWPIYAITSGATLVAAACPWMGGAPGTAGLFTVSLPVSRRRVLLTHAVVVGVEMVLIALAPSLMFPITSHLTGGRFPFGSAVVHALLLSLGGTVFISLSVLLTVILNNQGIVIAIGMGIVIALFLPIREIEEFPSWNVYHVMSGETYFRSGQIPWLGLLAWLAIAAALLSLAVRIYERRDF